MQPLALSLTSIAGGMVRVGYLPQASTAAPRRCWRMWSWYGATACGITHQIIPSASGRETLMHTRGSLSMKAKGRRRANLRLIPSGGLPPPRPKRSPRARLRYTTAFRQCAATCTHHLVSIEEAQENGSRTRGPTSRASDTRGEMGGEIPAAPRL